MDGRHYLQVISGIKTFSSRDFPVKWFPSQNNKNAIFRNYTVKCDLCLSDNCSDNICTQQIQPSDIIKRIEKDYIEAFLLPQGTYLINSRCKFYTTYIY